MPMQKNWEGNTSNQNYGGLPKPQKNAVIILAAFAVFIVVFWVWQMESHIKSPFDYGTTAATSTTEQEFNELLNKMDTDKDGLSDYDEIYTYKTSPYLEDTDSDGLSDKQEIDKGTDPNCPKGKDCNNAVDISAIATTTGSGTSQSAASEATTLDSSSADQDALQAALNGQSDATTLRKLLLSSGVSQEELDQVSDEELMKSYQQTLQSQSASETDSN